MTDRTPTGASAADHTPSVSAAALFDLRTVIAVLFGIYGVILTILGLLGTSPEDLEKAGGIALNLWTGIGMIVVAGLFLTWLLLRPAVTADSAGDSGAGDRGAGDRGAGDHG